MHGTDTYASFSRLHLSIAVCAQTISIFMINCGGNTSLAEALTLESRVTIYVLDSHRPYHHLNVHNEQIKLLHDSLDPNIKYPQWVGDDSDDENDDAADEPDDFDDDVGPRGMLSEEEDDDGDDDLDDGASEASDGRRADGSEGVDADGSPSAKRRKRNEKKAARRHRATQRNLERQAARNSRRAERRAMLARYEADLAAYYAGTSFGAATSVLMYELASQLNKSSNNELWLCMIGVSDTLVHERVEPSRYEAIAAHLSNQIGTFNTPLEAQAEALRQKSREAGSQATDALVTPVGHVADVLEYRFALVRHWNLYSALKHAPYVASRLQTWTEAGKERIRNLLTDIGIKTADARQVYKVMKASDKQRVEDMIETQAATDRYRIPDLRFRNFMRVRHDTRQTPHRADNDKTGDETI